MTSPLTYADFLAVFLGPPLALLVALLVRRAFAPRLVAGVLVLCAVGVLYTTPWGNALIGRGVWWYGDGAVLARVSLVPVEEVSFMVLQTVLTACWVALLRARRATSDAGGTGGTDSWRTVPTRARIAGAVAALAVGVAGAVMLSTDATLYMGALLAWASPVLAVQWAFGWPYLWRNRRLVAAAVGVPTIYLAVADRIAIELGVWSISTRYTTGATVAGLPIEEGAFFLLTNVFVVQGLLLYLWVVEPSASSNGTTTGRQTSNRQSGRAAP